jgi:hypothetical protein
MALHHPPSLSSTVAVHSGSLQTAKQRLIPEKGSFLNDLRVLAGILQKTE